MKDEELIAVLDSRFESLTKQLDGRFAQVEGRFAQIDGRFAQIDDRFAQIDERFAQIDERFAQIDDRFAQMDERLGRIDARLDRHDRRFEQLEARMESGFRHVDVQIEDLRDQTRRIVESVILVDEKLERFRDDVTREFAEMKSFNRISFRQIEEQSRSFDLRLTSVEGRVTALESKQP